MSCKFLFSYLFIDSDNANFLKVPGASCIEEMPTFSRLNEF